MRVATALLLCALALACLPRATRAAAPANMTVYTYETAENLAKFREVAAWLNARDDVLPNTTIRLREFEHTGNLSAIRAGAATVEVCASDEPPPHAAVGWPTDDAVDHGGFQASTQWVPLITTAARTQIVSFKENYRAVSRVVPAEDYEGRVMAMVARRLGWSRLAVISSAGRYTTGMSAKLALTAETEGLDVIFSAQVADWYGEADMGALMERLRLSGARVVAVAASREDTFRVLRAARRAGLVSARHVWLLPEGPSAADLARDDLADQWSAWDGALSLTPVPLGARPELQSLLAHVRGSSSEWPGGRDAALTVADSRLADGMLLAARAFESYHAARVRCAVDTSLANRTDCVEAARDDEARALTWFVGNTPVEGTRAPLALDEMFNPHESYVVLQHRHGGRGRVSAVEVARYAGEDADAHVPDDAAHLRFYGGRTSVPVDKPARRPIERRIPSSLRVAVAALAGLVAAVALALVAFTVAQRNRKIIKMSSPRINNLSTLGCGLFMGTLVFMGGGSSTDARCAAQQWLLPLSMTVIFGPLFAKIYRVHRIFNARSLSSVRVLKDRGLFLLVAAMLLGDAVLLGAWTAADPVRSTRVELTDEIDGNDFIAEPYVYKCDSEHFNAWFGAVVGTKASLIAAGAALAYKTRRVQIPALNDAKWVGFAVYNWAIALAFGLPVAVMLQDEPAAAYGMTAAAAIFAVGGTLALVHGPKLYAIATGTEDAWVEQNNASKMTALSTSGTGAGSRALPRPRSHRRGRTGGSLHLSGTINGTTAKAGTVIPLAPRRAGRPEVELPRLVGVCQQPSSAPGSPRTPAPPTEEGEGESRVEGQVTQ